MSKNPEAADLKSEKTKDIRMTNIIAARGKLFKSKLISVSRGRCCAHFPRTPRNGQNGKQINLNLECS